MNKRVRTPPPPATTNAEFQPGLFDGERPPSPWPDAAIFPHNEDGNKVKAQMTGLLAAADDALLISPATDLGSLFGMLTQWTAEKGRPLRLLLGKPPEVPWKGPFRARPGGVGAQIRELWMQKGLDVATMGQAVRVIALLKTKGIEARLFTDDLRAMDARMVVTDEAAIVGSSGLTRSGLEADVQSNIRIEREDTQKYQAARRFAEELWKKGLDWTDELEKLLRALVHLCTWQEALARACALVLDGDWAKKIDGTKPRAPLWPHQEVALSRGLYLLDQCGGLIVADATGSGKTKLGAALFAAALRRRRSRQSRQDDCALAFVPPGVKRDWEVELGQSIGKQQVESHGLLSGSEEADNGVKEAIQGARLLGLARGSHRNALIFIEPLEVQAELGVAVEVVGEVRECRANDDGMSGFQHPEVGVVEGEVPARRQNALDGVQHGRLPRVTRPDDGRGDAEACEYQDQREVALRGRDCRHPADQLRDMEGPRYAI